jgi:pimeloyl-ACP methyl ester carboxylesterase
MRRLAYKNDSSIRDYANILHSRIWFVCRTYRCERVILFGHSMGGLVSLQLYAMDPDVVEAVVTFASPVRGVPLLAHWPLTWLLDTRRHLDMRPRSTFLCNLHEQLTSKLRKRVLSIVSTADLHVPADRACLPGCARIQREEYGHMSMVTEKAAIDAVRDWMQGLNVNP